MVLVNRRMAGGDVASVTADDAAGIGTAVRHLADLGHRRIAHLAGPPDTSTGRTRLAAFHDALRDHDLPDDPALVEHCSYWTEAEGARAFRALLDGGAPFTAVIAGNDLVALGCYDVIAERGLSCPGEVSIVGYNDMPFVDKLSPPLTTMRVPHYDLGSEAAQMLLDTLRDPGRRPRSVLLPVSLVVRGSTASPAG
jgi:LacI family transcriptional regulator